MKVFTMTDKKKRPICICGEELKLVTFEGYYDEFNFFECDNSSCNAMDGPVDYIEHGNVG